MQAEKENKEDPQVKIKLVAGGQILFLQTCLRNGVCTTPTQINGHKLFEILLLLCVVTFFLLQNPVYLFIAGCQLCSNAIVCAASYNIVYLNLFFPMVLGQFRTVFSTTFWLALNFRRVIPHCFFRVMPS